MRFALAFTLLAACASTDPLDDVPTPGPAPAPTSGLTIVAPPDVARPPSDARVTTTGLAYRVLASGDPERVPGMNEAGPARTSDEVGIYYVGWTSQGRPFDDVLPPLDALRTRLAKLPLGLVEGVQLMQPGDTYRFWLPAMLTNPSGKSGAPPGVLAYDVKLVGIARAAPLPTSVRDFPGTPPSDAITTASGLVYKVYRAGHGASPTRSSKVVVHYTGWTTDGAMFDSSVERGAPATFPVSGVIPGFAEGLTLMQPGAHAVLWIPVELAYQGRPNSPAGTLVFDIDLIDIE